MLTLKQWSVCSCLTVLAAAAQAQVSTWEWNDGQTQGWQGDVTVENGALVATVTADVPSLKVASPELPASAFSSAQRLSFDLTVDSYGFPNQPLASPSELSAQIVITPDFGSPQRVTASLDMSRVTAFKQPVHFDVSLGDALAVANVKGKAAINFILYDEDSLMSVVPLPGKIRLDNVTLAPVPEPSAVSAALAGLALVGGWAGRSRRKD